LTASAHVAAQAKINLFLDVLERDPSGYHSLETAFLRIELADDVTVR
jgi:4-diphosphocytidyl-2C-methyl-D-erythritol kinase